MRTREVLSLTVLTTIVFWALPALADPNPPSIRSNQGAWTITRQWTPAETRHYAKWIENIYHYKVHGTVEQRTAKLPDILTDPAMNLLEDPNFRGAGSNPQMPMNTIRMAHNSLDCAKFVAFMPAYYAYRRGLPWMVSSIASGGGDIRTALNTPTGGRSNFQSGSVHGFFRELIQGFNTGNFRIELTARNAELSDTVPVAINREHLLPGAVNYLDGHSLILSQVDQYGELRFINASTTVTRDIFTYNGMNTVSGITPRGSDPTNEWGGCIQGMRIFRYPIAITNANGVVTSVRRRTNEEMKEFGFSTEQYDLIREISETQQIAEGNMRAQSFHDLIRLRMRSVDRINPLEFMEQYADEILTVYELREDFVQDAWRNVKSNGPITYPEGRENENIFQAFGRWETWSSPSSDVDRRNKYFYLIEWVDYAVRCYGMNPDFVDLRGLEKYTITDQASLLKALMAEKNRLFEERYMYYTKSTGDRVRLTLSDIEDRIYDLSFDPNHPPEIRWGAPIGSEERASAPNRPTPVPGGQMVAMEDAFRWQAYYRSLGQRETDTSHLRNMFTEGFPLRSRFDEQLSFWLTFYEKMDAREQRLAAEEAGSQQRRGPLVPRY